MTKEQAINHKQIEAIKSVEILLNKLKEQTIEIIDIQHFQNMDKNFGVTIVFKNVYKKC